MSTSRHHAADPAARLLERCRAAGLKATPQRLAVYRAVAGSREHPSPEEIFRSVRSGMPTLSLATVYKTLDALEELGLVERVANVGETRRYDANIERHHHLVCRSCGSITDFSDAALDRVLPSEAAGGFRAEEVSVQVLGTCARCQKEDRRQSPRENRHA